MPTVGPAPKAGSLRVLPDTNVWSYIADEGAATDLRGWSRTTGHRVLVSPAVVFEQLRLGNDDVRRRHLDVTTRGCWDRMMPEAYSECAEAVQAARIRRPDWVWSPPAEPAMRTYVANERDWKRGFWQRARKAPGQLANDIDWLDGGVIDAARSESKAARRHVLDAGWALTAKALQGWTTHVRVGAGPSRQELTMETWQFDAACHIDAQLRRSDAPTFHDWLDPFLKLREIDEVRWLQFWAELKPTEVPTAWLGWASKTAEPLQKVNDGSVIDSQITTYLNRADVLVTADKRFHRLLEVVRGTAPFRLATPVLVTNKTWRDDLRRIGEQFA